MSNLHVKYLLVGGGVAASAAASAIRAVDPDGDMVMIGQDINRPYHRLPLARGYLRGLVSRESLFTHPAEWFVDHHIRLRTGCRAAHLDSTRNGVTLENGETISFEKLLLATGATAVPLEAPGAQLPSLYSLRTLADADLIQHAMAKARQEGLPQPRGRGRAVIVGDGPQAIELAATITAAGLAVSLVLGAEHPLHRFTGETTGRLIARFLEAQGIDVHANDTISRLEGDGRIQRVQLSSGRVVPCDFVVAALGIAFQKELLRGTPIAAEHAILVDPACRTNVRDIFAAGDCAAMFDPLFGKHRLLQHWESAAVTGRIAGTNMAGGGAGFDSASYLQCDCFDLQLEVWGESRAVDRRVIRGPVGAEVPEFVEFGVGADGRMAQIITGARREPAEIFADLVRDRTQVDGREERLKDPSVPLHGIFPGRS